MRYTTLIPAVTLTLGATLQAADLNQLNARLTALEQERAGTDMITMPARPVVRDGVDLWLQGEALFMRGTESGLDYAVKSNKTTIVDGSVKNGRYDWTWGFRLGLGYNLPSDGWDLLLTWTRLNFDHNSSSVARSDQVLFPTDQNPDITSGSPSNTNSTAIAVARKGRATLESLLNVIDLDMGREFFVSHYLTMRPLVGLRGLLLHRTFDVKMKQTYDVDVPGFDSVLPTLPRNDGLKDNFHNRYYGVGLKTGLDTQWGLGSGFSLYGQVALALLYGNQKVRVHEKYDDYDTSSSTEQLESRNKWQDVKGMTDLALGLRWDHLFNNANQRIRLQAGWEAHTLVDFTKDLNFIGSNNHKFTMRSGNFGLTGLAIQARLDF